MLFVQITCWQATYFYPFSPQISPLTTNTASCCFRTKLEVIVLGLEPQVSTVVDKNLTLVISTPSLIRNSVVKSSSLCCPPVFCPVVAELQTKVFVMYDGAFSSPRFIDARLFCVRYILYKQCTNFSLLQITLPFPCSCNFINWHHNTSLYWIFYAAANWSKTP